MRPMMLGIAVVNLMNLMNPGNLSGLAHSQRALLSPLAGHFAEAALPLGGRETRQQLHLENANRLAN